MSAVWRILWSCMATYRVLYVLVGKVLSNIKQNSETVIARASTVNAARFGQFGSSKETTGWQWNVREYVGTDVQISWTCSVSVVLRFILVWCICDSGNLPQGVWHGFWWGISIAWVADPEADFQAAVAFVNSIQLVLLRGSAILGNTSSQGGVGHAL